MTLTLATYPELTRESNRAHLKLPAPPLTFALDLNAEFNGEDEPLVVSNQVALRQKIGNILGVLIGEEHFEPTFGSLIQFRLFDPVGDMTAFNIRFDTIDAIATFMSPDVQVNHSLCSVQPLPDGDGYAVDLVYSARGSRVVDPFKFRLMRNG
jgi:phage baseplate assembly protein W